MLHPGWRARTKRKSASGLSYESRFAALLDALRRIHDSYFDIGFKIFAALAVAIGWFSNQKNPIQQMCSRDDLLPLASVVIFLCYLATIAVLFHQYRCSQLIVCAMRELDAQPELYSSDVIDKKSIWLGAIAQFILFFIVWMSIYLVYKEGPDSPACQPEQKRAMAGGLRRAEKAEFERLSDWPLLGRYADWKTKSPTMEAGLFVQILVPTAKIEPASQPRTSGAKGAAKPNHINDLLMSASKMQESLRCVVLLNVVLK